MPTHWPNPSWLDRFLLENPWPATAILLVTAMNLGWHYLRSRQGGLLIGGVLCAIGGVGVFVAAWMVTTTRERLMGLDEQLVHAVAPSTDTATLERLFSESVDFQVTASMTQSQQRKPLLELIERVMSKYRLQEPVVVANDARATVAGDPPDVAESYFRVRVTLDMQNEGIFSGGNTMAVTDWLAKWQRQSDGSWRIITLRWLKLNGQEPSASLLP